MDKIIFFAILVLFPFGQLFKINILNLFDILVVLLSILTIIKKPKYPSWFKYFGYFVTFGLWTWIFNYFVFNNPILFKGLFYLFRLFAYSFVAIYINNYFSNKKIMTNYLLVISAASAIFGWIQYFIWPDLTFLKYVGWDDHLLRMVGTFIDPTYLGLIIVLGIIIAESKNFNKIIYFLLISLAFTYSRSSYLLAFLFLIFKKKYIGLVIFILSILILPKMIGEGTNLTRVVSGNRKLINYSETFEIIKKSPVIGVGYNNICFARQYYLNDTNTDSHSCNGSDSSILFLIATTGIVGLILFLNFVVRVPRNNLLIISFVAVLIHSTLANSMFYPHIMFWMFALIGLQTEVNSKSS